MLNSHVSLCYYIVDVIQLEAFLQGKSFITSLDVVDKANIYRQNQQIKLALWRVDAVSLVSS